MSNNTPNRPQINDVGAMPIGDIIQLPAEHLALLQEDASAKPATAGFYNHGAGTAEILREPTCRTHPRTQTAAAAP